MAALFDFPDYITWRKTPKQPKKNTHTHTHPTYYRLLEVLSGSAFFINHNIFRLNFSFSCFLLFLHYDYLINKKHECEQLPIYTGETFIYVSVHLVNLSPLLNPLTHKQTLIRRLKLWHVYMFSSFTSYLLCLSAVTMLDWLLFIMFLCCLWDNKGFCFLYTVLCIYSSLHRMDGILKSYYGHGGSGHCHLGGPSLCLTPC